MEVITEQKSNITIDNTRRLDGIYVITKGDLSRAEEDRVQQVASHWMKEGWGAEPRLPVQGQLPKSEGYYGTAMMHHLRYPTNDELLTVIPRRCARAAVVKLNIDANFTGIRGGDGCILSPALVYYVISDQEVHETEARQMARFMCLDDKELMKRLTHISGIITAKYIEITPKLTTRLMLYPCPSFSSAEELHKFNLHSVEDISTGQQVEVVCTENLSDTAVTRLPTAPGEQREVIGTKKAVAQVIFRPNPGLGMVFRPWIDELLSQLPSELFEGDGRYIVNARMAAVDHQVVNCEHIAIATVWNDIRGAHSVIVGEPCEACKSGDTPFACTHPAPTTTVSH